MLSQSEHLFIFVVMYMDNSMILFNSLRLVDPFLTLIIFSSEIMLIEVIILFKLFALCWPSKSGCLFPNSDTKIESPFSEETINQDQSHKAMAFMINVLENIKTIMSGKCLLISLIIYHWLLSYKVKFLVLMVVYLHPLLLLTIFVNLIDFNKYHMKEPFVIFFGVIQMKDSDLTLVQEVQDGLSDK